MGLTALTTLAGAVGLAGAATSAATTTCPSPTTISKHLSATQLTKQAPSSSIGSSSAFPGSQLTCSYSGSVSLTITYFMKLTPATKKTLESSFAKEHKTVSGIEGTGTHISNVMNASTGKSTTTKVTTSEVIVIPTDSRTPYEIEGNGSISSTLFYVAQALASKP